ncbi:MAG: DUF3828 domain-containing protein [Terracidiphilus sp.]
MRFRFSLTIALLAAVFLPSCISSAQDRASASSFLTSIFRLYDKGGKGVGVSAGFLHSSLTALIDADVKVTGSRITGAFGDDLFCACQEWDGFWVLQQDVKMESAERAQATVSFAVLAPKNRPADDLRTIQITLVPEGGQWRIYDIRYLSAPGSPLGEPKTLREQLRAEIDFFLHPPVLEAKS